MIMRFKDRDDAGRQLAYRLREYADRPDVLVLGLPRGGVPVAFETARALRVPLDMFLVRKFGVPGHEELGMGAIASGGARLLNDMVVEELQIDEETIRRVTEKELRELHHREQLYRNGRPGFDVRHCTVILVDDGLATGFTMQVAARALRQHQPAGIVTAVPVAAPETCDGLGEVADDVVCLFTPAELFAVGLWYEDFTQTSDDEVRDLLERARREWSPAGRVASV